MTCHKCGSEISSGDVYQYKGQKICEDCYLDMVAQPQTCDPWAVYHAQKTPTTEADLNDIQSAILQLVKEKGPLKMEDICSELDISETEFLNNFASLRHMELAKACKIDDEKYFTLFEDTEP